MAAAVAPALTSNDYDRWWPGFFYRRGIRKNSVSQRGRNSCEFRYKTAECDINGSCRAAERPFFTN